MITTFNKMIVKNFLGFGAIPVEFDFNRPGTTLIQGPNGVGKTTIMNALTYIIYDKTLSNPTGKKDEYINNINKKELEGTLHFDRGQKKYVVTRARKMKTGAAGNYVTVLENGKDITPDSIANGNKLVESIIGIPYDLFIRIIAISATYQPFLELPVKTASGACQTDIIEELFDLKSLTTKATMLKEQIKETKYALDIQHTKREALEDERERHVQQLETATARKEKWERDAKRELDEVTKLLSHALDIDVESEKKTLEEIAELNKELSEMSPISRDIKRKLREHEDIRRKANNELEHLEEGTCPYCLQTMTETKAKLKENKDALKVSMKAIRDHELELADILKKMGEVEESMEALEEHVHVDSIGELYKIESKIDKYESKIKEMQDAENPHIETLNELLEVTAEDFDMEDVNELEDLLKHQNMVLKLLTKKDSFVRKNLINKSIPFLNKRLNHYLHELQLPQAIEFKFDMTATVSKFGRTLDFGNLSAGQKGRVNLAMSFAFRDVLQNLHGYINVCMLDEVLDVALDAEGRGYAAEMLKRKGADDGTSIFVVSHNEDMFSVFESTIKVSMVDDFTVIEYPEN